MLSLVNTDLTILMEFAVFQLLLSSLANIHYLRTFLRIRISINKVCTSALSFHRMMFFNVWTNQVQPIGVRLYTESKPVTVKLVSFCISYSIISLSIDHRHCNFLPIPAGNYKHWTCYLCLYIVSYLNFAYLRLREYCYIRYLVCLNLINIFDGFRH